MRYLLCLQHCKEIGSHKTHCLSHFRSARVILSHLKCCSDIVLPCANCHFLWLNNVNALKDKIEQQELTLTRTVCQLASHPTPLADPYTLVAALEQLLDVSRETAHRLTIPLVWLLPVTSDSHECLVANILMTDTLDSFLLPLNLLHHI